jgi:hypothetical protein
MLTPKERDNLADLQEQMGETEMVLRRFNRRVEILLKQLECTAAVLGEERFEEAEVARLMTAKSPSRRTRTAFARPGARA